MALLVYNPVRPIDQSALSRVFCLTETEKEKMSFSIEAAGGAGAALNTPRYEPINLEKPIFLDAFP